MMKGRSFTGDRCPQRPFLHWPELPESVGEEGTPSLPRRTQQGEEKAELAGAVGEGGAAHGAEKSSTVEEKKQQRQRQQY